MKQSLSSSFCAFHPSSRPQKRSGHARAASEEHPRLQSPVSSLQSSSSAFTLLELLVVIAIIIMLVGMLATGANMAKEAARKTRSKSETRQIANAWKMYYSEYQRWPSLINDGAEHAIEGDVATLLSSGAYDPVTNPRRLRFCQFNRTNEAGTVINMWGARDSTTADNEWRYYVAVDHDSNNEILSPLGSNITGRSVIVWTANPKIDDDDTINNDEELIGDWKE